MKRVCVAAAVLVFGSAWAVPADAESLTFRIRSNHPNIVQVEFYSQNYNRAWPGGSQAYEISDYDVHSYRLNCRSGEKICFGAWVKGSSDYWGVGPNDEHGCSSCCYTCNGGTTPIENLNP